MKAYRLSTILGSFVCLLILGCSKPTDRKADKLYIEAIQFFDLSGQHHSDYSDLSASYKNAKARIEQIFLEYPSSNIAHELSSGEKAISGFTLDQFRRLESSLDELAEAERNPLSCALLAGRFIDDQSSRITLIAKIAGDYVRADKPEQALQLLSQAHESARTNTWPDFRLLCAIAGKFAELDDKEQASRILSDAVVQAQRAKRFYDGVEWTALGSLPEIAVQFAAIGDFEQALQTANIAQQHDRARAFAEIAGVYIQNSQKQEAEQLLSKAFEAAQTKISTNQKISVLVTIADNYAEINQPEQASQVLMHAMTTLGPNRSQALADISIKYAEWGQIDQALKLSEKVENTKRVLNSGDESRVLAAIAVKYAELGDLDKALSLVRKIDGWNAHRKCMTLTEIGRASALAGEKELAAQLLSEAIDIAGNFRDTHDKAEAYLRILSEYEKMDELRKAEQLLFEACQLADSERLRRTFPYTNSEFSLFTEMASMYRKLGQEELSKELLTEVLQSATTIQRENERSRALLIVAGGYAEAGQNEKATQLLSKALKTATTFEDAMLGHEILGALAVNYAKAGDFDTALMLARAIESHANTKSQALTQISRMYTEIGQERQAAKLLAEALQSARAERNLFWKSEAFVHISDYHKESGQKEQAIELLSEALQAAVNVRVSHERYRVLFDITVKYAELGKFSEALETAKRLKDSTYRLRALSQVAVEYAKAGDFDKGLQAAASIETTFWKCKAWVDIAGIYIALQETEKASMLLSQALDATAAIEDSAQKSVILIDLADTYTALGQEADALQLLSEALETEKISSWDFADIAAVYMKIGRNDKASDILAEARKAIMSQEDATLQSIDLSFLADSCARAGNLEQALVTVKLFDEIEPNAGNAFGMGDVAFAWTSIAEKVAELSEEDTEILRKVTHAVMPICQLSTYFDRLNITASHTGK